jgi:hypothetical protein
MAALDVDRPATWGPFVWTADPQPVVEKVRRGYRALASTGWRRCSIIPGRGRRKRVDRRRRWFFAPEVVMQNIKAVVWFNKGEFRIETNAKPLEAYQPYFTTDVAE